MTSTGNSKARRRASSGFPLRLLWTGGFLVLLAGCATVPPPIPAPEAQRLLLELDSRRAGFTDLGGLADVAVARKGQTQGFLASILLQAPASFRVEALSLWGQTLFVVTSDGKEVTLFSPSENRAILAPATAESARRWLGLEVGPEELVSLLAGYVLLLPEPRSVEVWREEQALRLELRNGNSSKRIWLDPSNLNPLRLEWIEGHGRQMEVRFERNGAVLSGVTILSPDQEVEVSIRYRQARVGMGLDPERFRLALPTTTKIRRLR